MEKNKILLTDMKGNKVEIENCLGCEISNGKLDVFGGLLYQGKSFAVAQDFELPIDGFIIVFSKRHIEKFIELTRKEQVELTNLISKTLNVLEKNRIADEYNVVFEEKAGYHFHIWLMPRHKWMIEKFGKVLKNIKPIQDYALQNMRTQENYDKIQKTCNLIKRELNDK